MAARAAAQPQEPVRQDAAFQAFYFASADAAQTALHGRLDAVLKSPLKNLQAGMAVANRQLDSPRSYQASARRMAACPT